MTRIMRHLLLPVLMSTSTFSLAAPVPGIPEGVDDAFTVDINSLTKLPTIANDVLNASVAPLSVSNVSGTVAASPCPGCGGYTVFDPTTISFQSNTNTGTAVFFYVVQDAVGSTDFATCDGFPVPAPTQDNSCAVVTVTVTYIADAPNLGVDAAVTVDEDASRNLDISASLSDTDGLETLSVFVAGLPAGANLSDGVFSSGTAVTNVSAWNLGAIEVTPPADDNTNFTLSVTARSEAPNGDIADTGATIAVTVDPVDDPPVATADSYSVDEGATLLGTAGIAGTGVLGNDTDIDGDPLTTAITIAPTFASAFSLAADGSFSYTHDGSENFSDTFVYDLDDGTSTRSATVTLTITPQNDNTTVTNPDSYALPEGGSLATSAGLAGDGVLGNDTDADMPGDTLAVTLVTSPTRASSFTLLADGSFAYTHDGSENFTDSFAYEVNDGTNTSATANVTLTITPINDNITATAADLYVIDEGATLATTAGLAGDGVLGNDSDPDLPVDTLSVSQVGPGPAYASAFTLNADGSFTYQHDGSENLSDAFSYTVGDGIHVSATTAVTITMNPVNDNTPTAADDSYSADEGTTLTGTAGLAGTGVLSNDSDLDQPGDTHLVSVVTAPTNASAFTLSGDGSFSYTHNGSENFVDSFTYQVSDGVNTSAFATVNLTLVPVNDNTTIVVDDGYSLAEGDSVAGTAGLSGTGVLGNDSDADLPGDALLVTLLTAPLHAASFTLNADGSFSYLHNDSENFSDSFTYSVSDGVNTSAVATALLTVTPVNDNTPLTMPDSYTLDEGATLTRTAGTSGTGVLGNDTDADGNSLTVTLVSSPLYAAGFTLQPDGSFSYTHDDSENLLDSFTYQVSDGVHTSVVATATVNVNPLNDNVSVAAGDFAGAVTEGDAGDVEAASGTISITDIDVTDTPVFADITISGLYGSLDLAAGTWTYTLTQSSVQFLDLSDVDTDTITLTASDGTSHDIVITITGTNDTPDVADQAVTLDENSASGVIVTNLAGTDADADDVLSYAITGGLGSPVEFTVNGSGDLLVGNHTPDQELLDFETTPSYSIVVEVTDALGVTDTATVTITLADASDPPGTTICEEFDGGGLPLGVLPGYLAPLTAFYSFTSATPCHRVIDADDYYMEQGKKLVAASPVPTPQDTPLANYRIALSDVPRTWDQDSSTLYFAKKQAVTGLLATVDFTNEAGTQTDIGEFVYEPPAGVNASDDGLDHFVYRVCDDATDQSEDHCALGVVYVNVTKTEAASVSTDNVLGGNEDLSQGPLELPVPAIPNVFVLLDDSDSMASDIMTDQSEGFYAVGSQTKTYFMPEDGSGKPTYADTEKNNPGKGLWRLRNANYNKVYYNPAHTYKPWTGVNNTNSAFTNALPTAAISNPYKTSSAKINLTTTRNMPNNDKNVYLAHYYTWADIDDATNCPGNVVGVVDGDSPYTDPGGTCTEGTLVEIKPAADGGSDTYPKASSRTDCAGTTCTWSEEIQNFANFYSYARTRHYAAKSSLGAVIAASENMRVGFGAFGGTNDNINIAEMNESPLAGNKGSLLERIYRNNAASNSTPIRESLERTGRYFACESSRSIITSGATCPVLPAPEGNCQQNFALVVTAGFWNASGPSNDIANDDSDTVNDFDGGRYADTATQTLADVAMYFYKNDLHPALANEVPATDRDIAGAPADAFSGSTIQPTMHQHLSTYVIAFGVSGTVAMDDVPTDYTTAFSWGDALTDDEKLNDLVHTAVNGRGDYLNASNPEELDEALENAFTQFSQAIGTASAVSFNSQEIQEDLNVYRAFYNIRENTGDLIAQELASDHSLGDTVWSAAEQLDLKNWNDREILTFDPTVVNGAGGKPFRVANLNSEQQLALEDDPGSSIVDFSAEFTTQITKHVNYLRGDAANERPLGNLRERPAVKGRLGDIVSSTPVYYGAPTRTRRNSPPYPTAEPYIAFQAAHASRTPAIYVASNDGMAHGFDAVTGEELFAFVPNHIITGEYSQRIKQLLSTNYAHRFSVDLSIAVNDVYLDADRRSDTVISDKNWTTMMVGGYRAGGKGYFALDITDPDVVTEANAANVVMWEFTDEDDIHPLAAGVPVLDANGIPVSDLGYTYSPPTIAMSNTSDSADGENRWVALFGNGYNSSSGKAALFVLFAGGGTDGTWCHPAKTGCPVNQYDFIKIEAPAFDPLIANGLGTPRGIDMDGNGTVDVAYAGDRFGNLYRFDLRDPDPTNWDVTVLFQATYYNPSTLALEAQPITTQPLVVVHPTKKTGVNCYTYNEAEVRVDSLCGGYIVVIGTGTYLFEGDDTSTEVQSLYGIWDRLGATVVAKSDLVMQEYTAIEGDANVGDVRILSDNPVDYNSKFGWYNNLDYESADGLTDPIFPGEKAIRNIQFRGGIVFVNSVMPKTALSCTVEAGGAANAFCPGTGSLGCRESSSLFDVNGDGLINDSDLTEDGEVVASTYFEDSVPTDSTFIGGSRVTQLSDQSLEIRLTDTSEGSNTGRISWTRLMRQ